MKPISLCLLLQGNKGFKLVREYPKVLPLKVIRKTIPDVILKDTKTKNLLPNS